MIQSRGGRFGIDFTSNIDVVAKGWFLTAEKMEDFDEPMQRMAEIMAQEIAWNFVQEGNWEGKWDALQDSTIAKKAAARLDPRILRATGALMEAATASTAWSVHTGKAEGVAQLQDPTGYGFYHLTGGEAGNWFLPIRDWAAIGDEAADEIEEMFYDWLYEDVLEHV